MEYFFKKGDKVRVICDKGSLKNVGIDVGDPGVVLGPGGVIAGYQVFIRVKFDTCLTPMYVSGREIELEEE